MYVLADIIEMDKQSTLGGNQMFFYKYEGPIADMAFAEIDEDPYKYRAFIRRIRTNSDAFNQKLPDNTLCFLSRINENALTVGMITNKYTHPADTLVLVRNFLKSISLEATELSANEVTFRAMCSMLSAADRESYISDDDNLLEQVGIAPLNNHRGFDFGEHILKPTSKNQIYETVSHCSILHIPLVMEKHFHISIKKHFYNCLYHFM